MNRPRRRRKGRPQRDTQSGSDRWTPTAYRGGRYAPLDDAQSSLIVERALSMLERIGMSGAPDWLRDAFLSKGAMWRSDARVTFPRVIVEAALARAARNVSLPGLVENRGLQIGGGFVHIGTGGAAVQVLDAASEVFRPSELSDLYQIMRVLDRCPNIHYGVRPLVARDMTTPFELDVNTAYVCARATGKPIGVSFDNAGHVQPVVALLDMALGEKRAFRKQPFCMAVIVHVVPPLRFASEGMEIMRSAIAEGMVLQICSAGQAGATSPASLAGALAQGLAESLAGMMVVDTLAPGHPCIFAFMPFISDLRTGAMSGGGGESAVANAAAAQLLQHLGLPSTVSAGMTDAKLVDAQAGYEKGHTVALAAQAGADMINLSVGMLGSIMVASPEAMVIDDEMCGAILRAVRGIEVSDSLLDLDVVERVVTGEGHYLGESQTLSLMKTEYVYPMLGDRRSVSEWEEAGRRSLWDKARQRVSELSQSGVAYIAGSIDRRIRSQFPIRLD